MKHGEGKELAHDLYVYHQMTYDEIATRTGRSEKTIRTWADEGGWSGERERDLKSRINVHEKLHALVDKLTDRMIRECEGTEEISPQRLHALSGLIASMNKCYRYEDDKQADEPDTTGTASPETIAEKVKELLGA